MQDKLHVLLSREQIIKKVEHLAQEISQEYQGEELLMICILKGAVVFFSDLIRSISVPVKIDFMAVSSYGKATKTSGVVQIIKDLDASLKGRHVVIVEDIIDTGLTLKYLVENLEARKPASLKICVLLDKVDCRQVEISADYQGFVIPDEYVVGYGLDCAEKYRNLADVCVLQRS
ncbi:hypoxanthine phosphoribosyltransferase [Candidatus Contubernalis alkaliaceticus]|uniref:hypoxanthine phosphoribosyltransferase n=1 Tax=Candidatus Contubernalis alkaliaceticus TaxID=338645 RepID=UPI001F4BDDD3|nr:hypoxanthine phosphoribosyltransferase [Candidatus Contubernalis alkalaceticus]UNC90719.1 hypoxanthine phosphoribosyltransferase [Candidatus Contubernalis alkalaceticus]